MASEGIPPPGQQSRGWATPLYVPVRDAASRPPRPEASPVPLPEAAHSGRPQFVPSLPATAGAPAVGSSSFWLPPPSVRDAPRRRPGPVAAAVAVTASLVATVLSFALLWYGLELLNPASAPVAPPDTHTREEREPRARAMPTPSVTPSPAPPAPPAIGASLYPLTLAGTCGKPRKDSTWAGVQVSIKTEALCLEAMWRPVVEKAGGRWTKPALVFYSDPIARTPCGPTPDKEKAPAHYCPGNQTIYVSDGVADAVVRYRMLGFEVISHEYVHHVQELVGILDGAGKLGRGDVVTRRVELQAHCMAYVALVSMDGLDVTTRELDQLKQSWRYSGDPEGHGSPEAQTYWGDRGIDATSLGACDTFSAADDLVT